MSGFVIIIVTLLLCMCVLEGLFSKFLFWLVDNVPLGRLAPYVFGLAIGRMPTKTKEIDTTIDDIEKRNGG